MPRILLVDDDPHIRDVVRFALEKSGYEVEEAADGQTALARAEQAEPDLVILDVMLPEIDGTEVCRRLRGKSAVPIVFLSSRDDEIDRVLGFELGGDDYVTKPFSPRELVARVRAVLRRRLPEAGTPAADRMQHGRLALDLGECRCFWESAEITLTAMELSILKALMGRPGKVFTRDALIDAAYGVGHHVSDRTVDSHIRRLRAKFSAIGAEPIVTLHGIGYKLSQC